MKHTTMLSLSSIMNDSEVNNFLYHTNILNMFYDIKNSNFVLCRSFISNEVYARLGHKDYDNTENFDFFVDKLLFLAKHRYDVKVIILATSNSELERRLGKREKFEFVEHTVKEAKEQQRKYLEMASELRERGLSVSVYNNSGMSKSKLCKLIMIEQDLE